MTKAPSAALAWFRRAAATGDADAVNMVGRCLENGWGAPVDLAGAARCYRQAAETGHDWAQYNLGHLHLNGLGVARDAALALAWYRRAANQGHSRAMNLVARCLEQGWGADADPDTARDWYRRSAEGGYFRGQFNYGLILADEGRTGDSAVWLAAALAAATAPSRETMIRALRDRPEPALSVLAGADREFGPCS